MTPERNLYIAPTARDLSAVGSYGFDTRHRWLKSPRARGSPEAAHGSFAATIATEPEVPPCLVERTPRG
jgi:hypothetical protein